MDAHTSLEGQIEHIVYHNDENGYTVARIRGARHEGLVTAVGMLHAAAPGEMVRLTGRWTTHARFGKQFQVETHDVVVPATVHGIEKYLGSGLIKGIGPVMAKRIVEKFGKDTLDIIADNSSRLAEVEGISAGRVDRIKRAWEEQREIRDVMLFLQAHDVSTGHATRIYKHYGRAAIRIVQENPYRLAGEVFGIGFLTADRIAEKLGIARDAPVRLEAGILHVLLQLSDEGHVFYPYEKLVGRCQEVLSAGREAVVQSMAQIAFEKKIVIEDMNGSAEDFAENNKAVYLAHYYMAEAGLAETLKALAAAPRQVPCVDIERALAGVQEALCIRFAPHQQDALRYALHQKTLVVTGGPGTGKTTIIKAVIQMFLYSGHNVLLAAPTGRAAKRMYEATGHAAQTIHRLLKYNMKTGDFEKNEDNPLTCDLLVVDEASMIDTVLMYHLAKAVPRPATILLIGDVNQLPSVGAGNVLKDIISSGIVPVVELKEIFRQARGSSIIVNAHAINNGRMPQLETSTGRAEDFYFIEKNNPEDVLKVILDLVCTHIPRRFGLDSRDDVQVLAPMHKGVVGTENLNAELQKRLTSGGSAILTGGRRFGVGDKVMQIKNNYDKDIFNGDMGSICAVDLELMEITVLFDGRSIVYERGRFDELALAYAVSVHKSQGSEFPAVVLPVMTQHYMLLQRNLIYTAITRGKKLVVLVGTRKALAIGVRNNKTSRRYTRLRQRLQV